MCAADASGCRAGGQLTSSVSALADCHRCSTLAKTVLPLGAGCARGTWTYLYLPRSIAAFKDVETYTEILENAGFVDVTVERLTMGVASIVRARRPELTEAPS